MDCRTIFTSSSFIGMVGQLHEICHCVFLGKTQKDIMSWTSCFYWANVNGLSIWILSSLYLLRNFQTYMLNTLERSLSQVFLFTGFVSFISTVMPLNKPLLVIQGKLAHGLTWIRKMRFLGRIQKLCLSKKYLGLLIFLYRLLHKFFFCWEKWFLSFLWEIWSNVVKTGSLSDHFVLLFCTKNKFLRTKSWPKINCGGVLGSK